MKIVISPAKTINETSALPTTVHSSAIFPKEIGEVSTALKALSPKQLINLMHISQKLADLNWQRHQQLSLPLPTKCASGALCLQWRCV